MEVVVISNFGRKVKQVLVKIFNQRSHVTSSNFVGLRDAK